MGFDGLSRILLNGCAKPSDEPTNLMRLEMVATTAMPFDIFLALSSQDKLLPCQGIFSGTMDSGNIQLLWRERPIPHSFAYDTKPGCFTSAPVR
jgi:hypothetical protein